MVLGQAGEGLRGKEELHVVDACGYVLRLCRDLRATLDEALQARWAGAPRGDTYVDAARSILEDGDSVLDPEFLHGAQLALLADFLDGATSPRDLALRASDFAQVIDEHRGHHFFSWFAGRNIELQINEPVPVPPGEVVVAEMGAARGLPPQADTLEVPSTRSAPLDGTPKLRLVPMDLGRFKLKLDARYHGVVDALFSGTRWAAPGPKVRWAAAIPSCALLEDLTYDLIDHVNPPGFYGVRPKPTRAEDYLARVLRVLDVAFDEGAAIIALPELSTDAEIEAAVVRWFHEHPRVALLLAGSRHLVGEPRRNRARVLMRGLAPGDQLFHDKFSSFSMSLEDVARDEWIERPNTLTLIVGKHWSFSALVCKDFMEVTPRRVLADLRVRAVLIAAMSPKTDLFVTNAAGLAQDAQAIVFVSNAPHIPGDDIAILARPKRGGVACCSSHQDS